VRYWAYLKYILWHKWYVFLECCRLGIPWLGIIHDLSKLTVAEFIPYARTFYEPDGTRRDWRKDDGFTDKSQVGLWFDYAWLHHQRQNKHHWQYWILVQDEDTDAILPMPDIYRREMLADWRGAGKALNLPDAQTWYTKHRAKIKLHPSTRQWIEEKLRL
jgi:hypothetical protein